LPVLFGDAWVGLASEQERVVLKIGQTHPDWPRFCQRHIERELQIERAERWLLIEKLVEERRGRKLVRTSVLRKALVDYCDPVAAAFKMELIQERSVWDWAEKLVSERGEFFALVIAEILTAVDRGELPATFPRAPTESWRQLLPSIAEAVRIHAAVTGGPLPRDEGVCTLTHRIMIRAADIENWLSARVPPPTTAEIARKRHTKTATDAKSRIHREDVAPIPNKPGGGGIKMAAAVAAMVEAVQKQDISFEVLRRIKQKELGRFYEGARRTTLAAARKEALKQLAGPKGADKAPT